MQTKKSFDLKKKIEQCQEAEKIIGQIENLPPPPSKIKRSVP